MSEQTNQTLWSKFCGTVILAVGVLLLLQTLEVVAWEVWEYVGPILLILWGILILRRPDLFLLCCYPRYDIRRSREGSGGQD